MIGLVRRTGSLVLRGIDVVASGFRVRFGGRPQPRRLVSRSVHHDNGEDDQEKNDLT